MVDSGLRESGTDSVAVVGIACRLPGAGDPGQLWELLRTGRDAVGTPGPGRRADLAGPGSGPAGLLDRIDLFDAGFFGISPAEAVAMDPRQRLVLELAWEAFEDAALDPHRLASDCAGVFVGTLGDDYRAVAPPAGRYSLTGLANGLIANRVSYALGLRGPSLTVDAAQASSLVAVHPGGAELAPRRERPRRRRWRQPVHHDRRVHGGAGVRCAVATGQVPGI